MFLLLSFSALFQEAQGHFSLLGWSHSAKQGAQACNLGAAFVCQLSSNSCFNYSQGEAWIANKMFTGPRGVSRGLEVPVDAGQAQGKAQITQLVLTSKL